MEFDSSRNLHDHDHEADDLDPMMKALFDQMHAVMDEEFAPVRTGMYHAIMFELSSEADSTDEVNTD